MYGAAPYATTPYAAVPGGAADAPPPAGASLTLALRVTMVEAENISLPLRVTMVEAENISLPLRVTMVEAENIGLPLRVTMVEAEEVSPTRWCVVAVLGGIDVSQALTGEVSVEFAEGEARIAEFAIKPAAGSVVLPDWTGKPVSIDIAEQAADGTPINPRRIFTGVVDVPDYDIAAGIVTFQCTDQRDEVLAGVPRDWIDAHIGGHYSVAVTGEPVDTLDYANARLLSMPVSLDLDAYQSPRVTPWHLPEPADLTFAEGDIVDESLRIQLASRADLRNEITTGLQYRFPRLRARVVEAQFGRTISEWTSQGLDIPARAVIEQALSDMSGWQQLGNINYVDVEPGQYESVGTGGTIYTTISATDAPNLALAFSATFYSRWVQWVTEEYALTVRAQASIDAIGLAREEIDGAALDAEFDDAAWLDNATTAPVLSLPPVGDVAQDYGAAGADRSAADAAITTLVSHARTDILSSHRASRAGATVPVRAAIDVDRRIHINTSRLRVSGKCARGAHRLNIDSGEAVTEFEVAVSGFAAVGLQPDDDIESPEAPADDTPSPGPAQLACEIGLFIGQTMTSPEYNEETMIGYSTNAKAGADYDPLAPAYPLQLTVGAPEIESAVRDPITLTQAAAYAVAIPQDLLEIIAP